MSSPSVSARRTEPGRARLSGAYSDASTGAGALPSSHVRGQVIPVPDALRLPRVPDIAETLESPARGGSTFGRAVRLPPLWIRNVLRRTGLRRTRTKRPRYLVGGRRGPERRCAIRRLRQLRMRPGSEIPSAHPRRTPGPPRVRSAARATAGRRPVPARPLARLPAVVAEPRAPAGNAGAHPPWRQVSTGFTSWRASPGSGPRSAPATRRTRTPRAAAAPGTGDNRPPGTRW